MDDYTATPETVVCFGGEEHYKRAALLFRKIVPLGHFPFDMLGNGGKFEGVDVPNEIISRAGFKSLVGDSSDLWMHAALHLGMYRSATGQELSEAEEQEIEGLMVEFFDTHDDGFDSLGIPFDDLVDKVDDALRLLHNLVEANKETHVLDPLWDMSSYLATNKKARFFTHRFLKRAGLDFPVVLPGVPPVKTGSGVEEVLATFANFPQIDVSRMSWGHVAQVREDPAARLQLHRLCNVAFTNYRDKPFSFVEDSVGLAIQDYRRACTTHGISLGIGQLQVILKSTDLLRSGLSTLLGASAAAAQFGSPLGALAAGFTVGIAELALTFSKQRSDFDDKVYGNPLAYVFTMSGAKPR